MTVEQAVAVLREHNAWRRGAEMTPMGDPTEIGIAIDVLIDFAEQLQTIESGVFSDSIEAWAARYKK